jgi:hypothetical protein
METETAIEQLGVRLGNNAGAVICNQKAEEEPGEEGEEEEPQNPKGGTSAPTKEEGGKWKRAQSAGAVAKKPKKSQETKGRGRTARGGYV